MQTARSQCIVAPNALRRFNTELLYSFLTPTKHSHSSQNIKKLF